MKILFISASPLEYSASANMRNIALLSGFIENGCDVYTLTPRPQIDSKLYDETMCDIEIKKKYYIEMGNIRSKITIKKGKKAKIKKIIYKILSKFKLYDFRSSLANKKIIIKEKFDYIISSSDPKSSHLIAENLIKNNPGIGKHWIQYWGDPFASDINKKTYLPQALIKKEEKRLISICNQVIYVSPFTLEKQKELYPQYKEKMKFYPIPYRRNIIYPDVKHKKYNIGYYGDYSKKDRNILELYNTIAECKDEFCLRICGNSDTKINELENIEIKSRQNLNSIREYEAETDILVCICNRKGTQIPGKLYHYAATNKPILVIVDGEYSKQIEEYLNKFNRYTICLNKKDNIKEALEQIKRSQNNFEPCKMLNAKKIAKEIIEEIK